MLISSSAIVKDRIRHLVDEAQAQIVKLTALDDRPFTMNDHYLTDVRVKLLAHLKEKRFPKGLVLDQAGHDDTVRTVLSGLNKIGIAGLKEDDLAKLRSTDEYEIELEVMAEIRAYWQVAYKVGCAASLFMQSAHVLSESSIMSPESSMPSLSSLLLNRFEMHCSRSCTFSLRMAQLDAERCWLSRPLIPNSERS